MEELILLPPGRLALFAPTTSCLPMLVFSTYSRPPLLISTSLVTQGEMIKSKLEPSYSGKELVSLAYSVVSKDTVSAISRISTVLFALLLVVLPALPTLTAVNKLPPTASPMEPPLVDLTVKLTEVALFV
jgi:hypothetical protein